MTVEVCPACGYPTIGTGPCAFCRPVLALAGDHRADFPLPLIGACTRLSLLDGWPRERDVVRLVSEGATHA